MSTRRSVFLAGATGAIGKRLVPQLVRAGYDVFGTTRSPQKAEGLRAIGVQPLIVDVFDSDTLVDAMRVAHPEVVIHQLTDLPPGLDPSRMAEATVRNARIRSEGTENLVRGALAAGARRLVAQSIAWAYAPGNEPHREEDPLDLCAQGARAVSVGGIVALERLVLNTPALEGIVLRYGQIYGPGTGANSPAKGVSVHVDAAAHAALLAVVHGRPGVYNIAEPNGIVTVEKAHRELRWSAAFRLAGDLPAGTNRSTL